MNEQPNLMEFFCQQIAHEYNERFHRDGVSVLKNLLTSEVKDISLACEIVKTQLPF